jgi:hypothetical protein
MAKVNNDVSDFKNMKPKEASVSMELRHGIVETEVSNH